MLPSEISPSEINENRKTKLRENAFVTAIFNVFYKENVQIRPKSNFEAKFQANQGMYGKNNAIKLSSTFS